MGLDARGQKPEPHHAFEAASRASFAVWVWLVARTDCGHLNSRGRKSAR